MRTLEHLNKIWDALGIVSSVSYVDEIDKQHRPKQYWIVWKIANPK
jgi:hypothetical protein